MTEPVYNRNTLKRDQSACRWVPGITSPIAFAAPVVLRQCLLLRRGAPAQVGLAVRAVENHLVTCIGMDGCHYTAGDGSIVVERLCQRSKAVCGAGSRRDNQVIGRERLLVYTINDSLQVVARGSGDNNLLGTCLDVSHALLFAGVESGALEHNVNIMLFQADPLRWA